MENGITQIDKLNNTLAELRRVARLQGIGTLLILPTLSAYTAVPYAATEGRSMSKS